MPMTLVVMAAGRGTRFGGMKQLAPIGPSGEAMFDYAVYDALRSGFDDVVVVVSEASAEAVEEHVERGCGRHTDVRYALQKATGREKPWGTGHAVLTATAEVDGPFGVVNADDFYGQRSFDLLGQELAREDEHHVLVGFRLRETLSPNGGVSRGVCDVENGFLASITELREVEEAAGVIRNRGDVPLTGDELISTNLWGFRASFAGALAEQFDLFLLDHGDDPDAEFLIGDGVASLPRYGDARVRVVPTDEKFLGVTFSEDVVAVRDQVATLVAGGRYPARLWG